MTEAAAAAIDPDVAKGKASQGRAHRSFTDSARGEAQDHHDSNSVTDANKRGKTEDSSRAALEKLEVGISSVPPHVCSAMVPYCCSMYSHDRTLQILTRQLCNLQEGHRQ